MNKREGIFSYHFVCFHACLIWYLKKNVPKYVKLVSEDFRSANIVFINCALISMLSLFDRYILVLNCFLID